MLVRSEYHSTAAWAIPQGQQYFQVTGLGITAFTPTGVECALIGDGTAGVAITGTSNLTTDGFTVTFSAPIPNGNFSLSFIIH